MSGKLSTITKTQMRSYVNKQKLADEAIGAMYGATRQAVKQLRDKMGIPARTARNAERDKKIRAGYKKGVTVKRLMIRHNLSMSQVYRIINAKKKKKKKRRK